MTLPDMVPVIEAQLGRKLAPGWTDRLVATIKQAMATETVPIPGGLEALHGVTALGLPWRIASNSSHGELLVKFRCIGASDLVAGRLHSFEDVAQGKPAPDLFLATAAAEGVAPENCVVIEDSTTGAIDWHAGWWWTKLGALLLMFGFHGAVSKWRRVFMEDRNQKPARFYRMANEVPTVLMIVIVVMVIVRPF